MAGWGGGLMPPSPTPSCDPRAAASALPPPEGSLFARFGSSLRLLRATGSEARFAFALPVPPILIGFRGGAGRVAWSHRYPRIGPGCPRAEVRDSKTLVLAHLCGGLVVALFHWRRRRTRRTPENSVIRLCPCSHIPLFTMTQGISLTQVGKPGSGWRGACAAPRLPPRRPCSC